MNMHHILFLAGLIILFCNIILLCNKIYIKYILERLEYNITEFIDTISNSIEKLSNVNNELFSLAQNEINKSKDISLAIISKIDETNISKNICLIIIGILLILYSYILNQNNLYYSIYIIICTNVTISGYAIFLYYFTKKYILSHTKIYSMYIEAYINIIEILENSNINIDKTESFYKIKKSKEFIHKIYNIRYHFIYISFTSIIILGIYLINL